MTDQAGAETPPPAHQPETSEPPAAPSVNAPPTIRAPSDRPPPLEPRHPVRFGWRGRRIVLIDRLIAEDDQGYLYRAWDTGTSEPVMMVEALPTGIGTARRERLGDNRTRATLASGIAGEVEQDQHDIAWVTLPNDQEATSPRFLIASRFERSVTLIRILRRSPVTAGLVLGSLPLFLLAGAFGLEPRYAGGWVDGLILLAPQYALMAAAALLLKLDPTSGRPAFFLVKVFCLAKLFVVVDAFIWDFDSDYTIEGVIGHELISRFYWPNLAILAAAGVLVLAAATAAERPVRNWLSYRAPSADRWVLIASGFGIGAVLLADSLGAPLDGLIRSTFPGRMVHNLRDASFFWPATIYLPFAATLSAIAIFQRGPKAPLLLALAHLAVLAPPSLLNVAWQPQNLATLTRGDGYDLIAVTPVLVVPYAFPTAVILLTIGEALRLLAAFDFGQFGKDPDKGRPLGQVHLPGWIRW